jgi:hypothetical protein
MTENESYFVEFTFLKCTISYAFLFEDPNDGNKIKLSVKSANSLADAMTQPNIGILKPLQAINFFTNPDTDELFADPLFVPVCKSTPAEDTYEEEVRESVLTKNASTDYLWFSVDAAIVANSKGEQYSAEATRTTATGHHDTGPTEAQQLPSAPTPQEEPQTAWLRLL